MLSRLILVALLGLFLILLRHVNFETDQIEYQIQVNIPQIAEKSYLAGCIKKQSQAKACKIKAKQYKMEFLKLLSTKEFE